ncbi:cytochrome P450 [Paenibacillus sp. GYB004]|uniref:cytochrome P450 n=1 Tax=Paenibacillus sp. GYB004 TaxID=2994393 RepID=UPI002F96BF44
MIEIFIRPHSEEKHDISAWFRSYSEPLHGDPYPFYNYLLEREPIYYISDRNQWVTSRYEDVNRILKDPAFVREHRNAAPPSPPSQEHPKQEAPPAPSVWKPVNDLLGNWMLFRDAPNHTRLRGQVSHAFTPRTMERLKPKIQAVANHLAKQLTEETKPDLIASYAFPLPVIVIAEMLGVPPEDRELFKGWSHTFARILEGGDRPPEFAQQAAQAAVEITDYFRLLIAEHRKSPREDMISDLLAAQGQGGTLTEQELIATCVLLLVAGHETTVNLIGNAVFTLLSFPEQLTRLIAKPELIRPAVDEVLRFEGPVQMTGRLASADYVIGGQTIKRGQYVTVMLGAANRDPSQFEQANRFDIGRTPNRHLAFASGPHFCLGAPLARMEGEIALGKLVEQFPGMRLADAKPDWRPNMLFRGLNTMRVEL